MKTKLIISFIAILCSSLIYCQDTSNKENSNNTPCAEIPWNHYFVRYKKVNEKNENVFSDKVRTWYFLSPVVQLKPDNGKIIITGFVPERKYGISKKLYEEIYLCYKTKDVADSIKSSSIKTNSLGDTSLKNDPKSELKSVSVKIPRGKIFKYRKWGTINHPNQRYWSNAFSLLTTPVKARGASGDNPRRTTSGLKNLGINLDFAWQEWHRYYSNGKDIYLRLAFGLLIGPTVEDVKANELINSTIDTDTKQLFLSWGITTSLSINDINFVFIPFGMDHATSSVGHSWAFNERRWWGFGIGVDTKALGAIFTKK